MTVNQVIAISAVGTFVAGVFAVLVPLRNVEAELWLQAFSEYTRRFSEIMKDLPPEARDPSARFDFQSLDPSSRGRLLNVLRAYANLCAEEHYLYTRKKIDRETWQIWVLGIEDMFRLPWFSDAWSVIRAEYRFYEPFCGFFDACNAKSSTTAARLPVAAEAGEAAGVRADVECPADRIGQTKLTQSRIHD